MGLGGTEGSVQDVWEYGEDSGGRVQQNDGRRNAWHLALVVILVVIFYLHNIAGRVPVSVIFFGCGVLWLFLSRHDPFCLQRLASRWAWPQVRERFRETAADFSRTVDGR
jgi:hypothetical protein